MLSTPAVRQVENLEIDVAMPDTGYARNTLPNGSRMLHAASTFNPRDPFGFDAEVK